MTSSPLGRAESACLGPGLKLCRRRLLLRPLRIRRGLQPCSRLRVGLRRMYGSSQLTHYHYTLMATGVPMFSAFRTPVIRTSLFSGAETRPAALQIVHRPIIF